MVAPTLSSNKEGDRQSTSSQRILRNGFINLGGQVLYAALQLIVVFLLARDLGKAGLGHYYTLVTLVLVVQLVVESGTATVLTLRIVQSSEQFRQRVAEASGVFVLISIASTLLILVLGGAWHLARADGQQFPAVLGAALACGAIQWQRFGAAVFQALERFFFENIAKILQIVTFVVGLILLIACGASNMNTVMAVLAVSHILASVFLLVALWLHCGGIGCTIRIALAFEWIRRAIPLGWGDVLRKLIWQADTIGLAIFSSPAQVGLYSVAYRPLGVLNWIPRAVLSAAFPAVARVAGASQEATRQAFARSTRLLVVVGLPIAIGMFVAAEPLIELLAGEQFADSVRLLHMMIWIIVLSFVSQQFRFFLTAANQSRQFAKIGAIVLGAKLALLGALVPWFGCYGACLSSLVAEVMFTIVGLFVCSKVGIVRIEWRLLGKALGASLLMAGLAWWGHQLNLFLLVPWLSLAAAVYFLTCRHLGVLHREECDQIKQVYNRAAGCVRPLLQLSFRDGTP